MSGYVDLQVNGYAGCDFNADDLSLDSLVQCCQRLREDGVDQILATVITDSVPRMIGKIKRIADAINRSSDIARTVAGIHVEGPFLNPQPGFIGAHPAQYAISASQESAERLVDAGLGHVRMFTLAPECEVGEVTKWLTEQRVVVAAGHTDATIDELNRSADAGLSVFTHLGNGCPGMLPRHDNIIQRALSLSDILSITLIADGHHLPLFALRNYLSCVPDDNIVIVTDAISAAGMPPGRYHLGNQVVEVDEDRSAWAEGRNNFAGCATRMHQMASILHGRLGISKSRIDDWTRGNPLRILGLGS